jgi:hypothetical protein
MKFLPLRGKDEESMKNSVAKHSDWKHARPITILAGFLLFCVLWGAPAASAAGVGLDENEEIQWVMGDLSALKTAAQTCYADSGRSRAAPSLPKILRYFDDDSLPPNAASLYAVRSDGLTWYVGYRAAGLKNETHRLLHENANTLALVGDDLRSPWRRGSSYIWSPALSLSYGGGAPRTTIRRRDPVGDAIGVAAVTVGAAILLNIVDDHRRGGYYYHYPKHPWQWRSALAYRRDCRDRLIGRYRRPGPPRPVFRPGPRPRAAEIAPPRHEGPPRRDPRERENVRRPGHRPGRGR